MVHRVRKGMGLRRLVPAAALAALALVCAPAAVGAPAEYGKPAKTQYGTPRSSASPTRASASATSSVSIVDFAFDPTDLSVKVGDTVQWINYGTADEGHNVIGDGLQSPVLHTGESYVFTFSTAGTYSYECTIHPKMKATIEVVDPTVKEPKKTKQTKKAKGATPNKSSSSSPPSSSFFGGAHPAGASGTESAAAGSAGSPTAGGSGGSLPSTGSDLLPLLIFALLLLDCGLGIRVWLGRRTA